MQFSFSVSSSKKTLQYQAEEGARLDSENKDLQFRLAQLKETHTYEYTLPTVHVAFIVHIAFTRIMYVMSVYLFQGECAITQRGND